MKNTAKKHFFLDLSIALQYSQFMNMKIKKAEKHDQKKLERLWLLRRRKRMTAKMIAKGLFDPSYVYHVESGRCVSRQFRVENAIAKALGTTWEKI